MAEIKQLRTTISSLMDRLVNLELNVEVMTKDTTELHNHVDFLEQKIDDLENRSRRQNIVLYGVHENTTETWNDTETKVRKIISDQLGVEDMQRCHRAGNKNGNKDRPIVCKLLRDKKKEEILRNARKLKGTNIYIEQDFSTRTRNIRNSLKPPSL